MEQQDGQTDSAGDEARADARCSAQRVELGSHGPRAMSEASKRAQTVMAGHYRIANARRGVGVGASDRRITACSPRLSAARG
jgi:hypothetical protein